MYLTNSLSRSFALLFLFFLNVASVKPQNLSMAKILAAQGAVQLTRRAPELSAAQKNRLLIFLKSL